LSSGVLHDDDVTLISETPCSGVVGSRFVVVGRVVPIPVTNIPFCGDGVVAVAPAAAFFVDDVVTFGEKDNFDFGVVSLF
jgi:hypothetical protein